MTSPLCILRGIASTLRTGVWLRGQVVSGHAFVEVNEGQCEHVTLLKCSVCGHYSMAWERVSEGNGT